MRDITGSNISVTQASGRQRERAGFREWKHKVSQGYSPADNNAGSLTFFEMALSK
jgi:hypothetical protein